MSKRFSERILDFLARPDYRPMKTTRLARAMGIAEVEYGDFRDAVDALHRVGRVAFGTGNAVMLPHPPGQVVGTFRANPRGFGFVVPDESTTHGDLYIPAGASLDAVTGDKVLCRVVKRGKRGDKMAFGGQIIRVLQRGNSRFVGQLSEEGGVWFVQPDGNTLHVPVLVGDAGAKSAKQGDQVVVEIVQYPSEGRPAKGVIVERLGKWGKPGVDMLSIIRQYQLRETFPEEALEEARAAVHVFDPEAAAADREDLSNLTIITIDPDDAKDFDDAISLERLDKQGPGATQRVAKKTKVPKRKGQAGAAVWELGVHIADVSAFVAEGGPLDEEAVQRGTSVYFPGHVIPMLPEVLSNGVCSLQEAEPRLTKSAFIQYDGAGRVVGTRFANTVIRSAKRLTYGQAQAIVDGKKGRMRKNVVDLVQRMNTLARAIQRRRLDEGMIVLDLPAVDLILDDNGRVTDAVPEDTSFSHTIIEMFMVEANEAVGRFLQSLGLPFLRRIHEEPDEASLVAVARFLRAAGFPVPEVLEPADLQGLLASLRGKPEGHAVSLAILKSMQMAEYSPAEIGHFALASDCYTHFTSPIRRYPDLMVHRLLNACLTGRVRRGGRKGWPEDVIAETELEDYGRRLSYASRRAESAERELKTVKILGLLSEHVGEVFEGVVTGVTNFGLFVQHPKYLIDGLLRIEQLGDDWWDVDVRTGRITGERSRQTFALGRMIQVRIMEVDVSARQLDLSLVSAGGRGKAKAAPKPIRRGRQKGGSQTKAAQGRKRPTKATAPQKNRGRSKGSGRRARRRPR